MERKMNSKPHHFTSLQLITMGLLSEITSTTITAPLDVIRITMQMGTAQARSTAWQTAIQLFNTEGFFAFFKGNHTHCWCLVFSIVANNAFSSLVSPWVQHIPWAWVASLVKSTVGSVMATIISYPIQFTRIQLIKQDLRRMKYEGMLDCMFKMLHERNFLISGIDFALVQSVSREVIRHLCYAILNDLLKPWKRVIDYRLLHYIFSAVSQLATYPTDTLVRRKQANTDIDTGTKHRGFISRYLNELRTKRDIVWSGVFIYAAKLAIATGVKLGLLKVLKIFFLWQNGYTTITGIPLEGVPLNLTPSQLQSWYFEQRRYGR